MTYPVKETIKIITITKQAQKINFQIRHPENVYALTGIGMGCDKISDPVDKGRGETDKGNTAGYLSLSIPQKGDVVFGEDVKLDNNAYADITEQNVYRISPGIVASKKRGYYFNTYYRVDKAILEGFYEDTYLPKLTSPGGDPLIYLYKIRIYIRYQAFNEMKNVE